MIATRFGDIDYIDGPDTLAVRHNLRVDAMRALHAAAHNRSVAEVSTESQSMMLREIARRQERNARNLLDDARRAK